jgi:hypothetical protein
MPEVNVIYETDVGAQMDCRKVCPDAGFLTPEIKYQTPFAEVGVQQLHGELHCIPIPFKFPGKNHEVELDLTPWVAVALAAGIIPG